MPNSHMTSLNSITHFLRGISRLFLIMTLGRVCVVTERMFSMQWWPIPSRNRVTGNMSKSWYCHQTVSSHEVVCKHLILWHTRWSNVRLVYLYFCCKVFFMLWCQCFVCFRVLVHPLIAHTIRQWSRKYNDNGNHIPVIDVCVCARLCGRRIVIAFSNILSEMLRSWK